MPAAIEDLSGQTIPKSLLDKSAAVNEKGGLNAIDVLMQELPELLQRNREILDEVRKPNGRITVVASSPIAVFNLCHRIVTSFNLRWM